MGPPREWLVTLRGDRTQEEVARLAGIGRSTLSNIELGRRDPSVPVAKRIAAVLGFDWTKFFEDVGGETQRSA